MVKTKFKKAVSLMLAAVMSLTAFTGIGATTAFAAVGEKADVYLVDYPRSGDTNNNGEWGHGNLNYMNGWKGLSTKYTGLRAMGSYSGNIAYCIEPGTGQRTGDTLTEKDENFFNNISPNGTISGDDIRLLIGRILQYGYRGGIGILPFVRQTDGRSGNQPCFEKADTGQRLTRCGISQLPSRKYNLQAEMERRRYEIGSRRLRTRPNGYGCRCLQPYNRRGQAI